MNCAVRSSETGIGRRISVLGWQLPGNGSACLDDCSLIIPTYRRSLELISLLDTLCGLSDIPVEVVIVDGSEDRTVESTLCHWLRDRRLSFALVYAQSPAGLTRQRNVGIDISSRPYVFFLDDDCLPMPGYFDAIRHTFVQDVRGEIGAVAGWVVGNTNERMSWRWHIRQALRLVPRIDPMNYHPSGTGAPRGGMKSFPGTRPIHILPGCAMAFRRTVLNQMRFSEFFDGYSQGEDLEMSLRMGKHWKIMWCGNARAVHKFSLSAKPTSFSKGRMEVRNRLFIRDRHASHASAIDRLRLWLDIFFIIFMDLAWFCIRPWRPEFLIHAAGLTYAVIECVIAPPRYEEPRASTKYELAIRDWCIQSD